MEWKKYQIDAVVSTISKKVEEKVKALKEKLKESFKPTKKQKEILDGFDELKELADKINGLINKYNALKLEIDNKCQEEVGTYHGNHNFSYYGYTSSESVEDFKKSFIDDIINSKIPRIPNSMDISDELTVATISRDFDIDAWIEKYLERVKVCEE